MENQAAVDHLIDGDGRPGRWPARTRGSSRGDGHGLRGRGEDVVVVDVGADTDQQGVVPVAESAPDRVLQLPQCRPGLDPQLAGLAALREVLAAGFGGDGESGWHR